MACIIISTDWRFKERFKKHFAGGFLREFSLAAKLVRAVEGQTVSENDCIIMDERLGASSQPSLLSELHRAGNRATVFLFSDNSGQLPTVGFPVRKVSRKSVSYDDFFASVESEFAGTCLAGETGQQYRGEYLVGQSKVMQEVRDKLSIYAKNTCSVHLYGETGTGKEIAAKTLHAQCFPARKMVSVNSSLLEGPIGNSLFFGHAKGAFTDGKAEVHGLVEEANGTTLFLDEIENMSPSVQANLLRILETGQYRRLGDPEERSSSFRLVTASNQDLEQLVEQGVIRKDLYYRVTDVTIKLPPLREHKEDIPELARYYLDNHFPGKTLGREDLLRLELYAWPGNVRQLFSTLRRCAIKGGNSPKLDLSAEEFA
jgi:two-component system NtrC family response regulator